MVNLTVSAVAETDPQGQVRQAGMGGWKKRMLSCNEADKGSKFALT